MSTDEMTDVTHIPLPQIVIRERRPSGIAGRLREKKSKAENILKAIKFAGSLSGLGLTTTKVLHLSIMRQHHFNTHEARAIARDAKPRKKRKRR